MKHLDKIHITFYHYSALLFPVKHKILFNHIWEFNISCHAILENSRICIFSGLIFRKVLSVWNVWNFFVCYFVLRCFLLEINGEFRFITVGYFNLISVIWNILCTNINKLNLNIFIYILKVEYIEYFLKKKLSGAK